MMTKKDAAATRFKDRVKLHIEGHCLSDQGMANIEALLANAGHAGVQGGKEKESTLDAELKIKDACYGRESDKPQPKGRWPEHRFNMLLAAAASMLLIALALQFYPYIWWKTESNSPLDHQPSLVPQTVSWNIADEVAKNHIKAKPLEVQAQNLAQLRGYFTELDFTIVSSSRLSPNSLMLGGRYCSIQGLTAAQIRFIDQEQAVTLYEVQYDKALYGELPVIEADQQPIEHIVRGVAVAIWVEKGLLMASARPAE